MSPVHGSASLHHSSPAGTLVNKVTEARVGPPSREFEKPTVDPANPVEAGDERGKTLAGSYLGDATIGTRR